MAEVFGIVAGATALLQTISQITDLISAIEAQQGSSVVLSFRPVQKDRIEALQHDLLGLIQRRQELGGQQLDGEALAAVNNSIDAALHKYGTFAQQNCMTILR